MDATMMMNNNYANMGAYGGYYNQPQYNTVMPYGYNSYTSQDIKIPQNQNALTNEEIATLRNARPSSKIDITVDSNDVLRAMCTHKLNGKDMVQQIQDGSGDVWCPICNTRWSPEFLEKEQVEALVKNLTDQMENAKWIGDMPIQIVREMFVLIPLLKKYPDVQEFCIKNFNKYYNQHQFSTSQDASFYSQYNSLFGPSSYGGYMPPAMGPTYYQQSAMPTGQPQTQQDYYFNNGNAAMPTQVPIADPYMNPIQAPMGVNPAAPNQQFVNQASMMMNGYAPQQPMMPQPGYNYGVPAPQAYQPANNVTSTTPDGSKVTTKPDGSVKSEKTVKI